MIDISEMSVLIADDMENMYTSIRSIMRLLKYGRKFMYVNNGEDALAALKGGVFDLAMLDNNMPGITGLELLGIIRNDKDLQDLPVIMITGHAEQEFITNAAESDIDAYLLKPITVNLLKDKIPQVIASANSPAPMNVHLKKAKVLGAAGDFDGAVQEAVLAAQANPKSTRPLRDIGYYYLQKDDLLEAERYLLQAAERNSFDVIAFTHLGDLYLRTEEVDKALKYFSKAMALSPRHAQRGLSLGKLLIRKGMLDKAKPVFTKVFELAKDPFALREEVAAYCIAQGAGGYAAKLLKTVLDQSPNRPELLMQLSGLCEDPVEAAQFLREAAVLDPDNPDIKLGLARSYLAQGLLLRAETPLKELLKRDPDNKEARDLLRQCI
jgi:CheY-like chemotaxis protein